ncbi:MAG: TlpA family protein disulfide reductase [Planctomycetes bacterium]|nr:TlpA family protein disulfide reductase [Planctomycetota bacterium]
MIQPLLLASLLLASAPALQDPAPPAAAPQSEARKADDTRQRELDVKLQLLQQKYAEAEREWGVQMRQNAADLEARKALAARHPAHEFWKRFEDLAGEGEGRGFLWLAEHAEYRFEERDVAAQHKRELFQKLIDGCASESWGMDTVVALSRQRHWLETAGVDELLYAFVTKTKNREFAAAALARVLAIHSGLAPKPEDQATLEAVRERILHDYPDTEAGRKLAGDTSRTGVVTPGASVAVGSPAPDFSGKDVDGKPLGLAELRGKVVLLDFWGFWNPTSRAAVAHLRELCVQHASEPFAILGIATDDDATRFRALSRQTQVNWPSIWDGGRTGPIAKLYRVSAFPTLFLIDAQGVILKSWTTQPADKSLDEEIERALAARKREQK